MKNPKPKVSQGSNFFRIHFSEKIRQDYPELIDKYKASLYRSTMLLKNKLILIDYTHTETAILEAIIILKNHYSCSEIKRRNQELENYLKQRMDSS